MKKIFYVLAIALASLMVSCNQNEALKHVPASADAVLVVDFDLTTDKPDEAEVDNMFKALEKLQPIPAEQKALMKDLMLNPEDAGIDFLKKWCAYVDYEGKDATSAGICIPLSDREDFEALLNKINSTYKDELQNFMSEKKTDGDVCYLQFDKDVILGWNDDVCMMLAKDGEAVLADLNTALSMGKSESILTNKDFKKFNKNCENVNLWVSSACMSNPDIVEALNDNFSYSDSDEKLFSKFLNEAEIQLTDNYLHWHLDIEDDEYTVVAKFRPNESLQNLDITKVMNILLKYADMEEAYRAEQEKYW